MAQVKNNVMRFFALCCAVICMLSLLPIEAQGAQTYYKRLAGVTRYSTMSRISQEAFPYGSEYVIVASGENFPDALAASSLAGALQSPIVLTERNKLSTEARAEIQRLSASTAVIIGGTSAVSQSTENEIRGIVSRNRVVRFGGATRYETAMSIYRNAPSTLNVQWGRTAIIATGAKAADALSISPYAYQSSSPLFLSSESGLEAGALDVLSTTNFDSVVLSGGPSAVPDHVQQQLSSMGLNVKRLGGAHRYETSRLIGQYTVSTLHLAPQAVVFATGSDFPDALAGGVLAGVKGSVLLLVEDGWLDTVSYAVSGIPNPQYLYVLGGPRAVSHATVNAIASQYGIGSVEQDLPDRGFVLDPVTPGAFCKKAQEGQKGYSADGILMVCSYASYDSAKVPRWRKV